ELSDGRVVSDTENTPTEGYTSRDKNAVYLGELPKTSLLDGGDGVTLDYYGDAPAPGVKLRLVKTGDGRVYLKIDAGKVNVLDETSEVKLVNGAAPKAGDDANGETGASPALAEIKPVKARRAGRLFGFGSAWKSGVRANLGQKKRGRKVLRNALILFAAVVVFMTASLGVFVRNLADVDATYHHHLIYAYAGDEISAAALAGIGEEAGVVYRQFTLSDPSSERTFSFSIGNFETFSGGEGGSSMLASSATAFLRAACEGRRLLAGKNTGLADDDALITEGMAKALLKEATVDYLRTYDDLIGVWSNSGGFRVAGVVEGDDREVFLSVERIAYWSYGSGLKIYVPSSFGTVDPPADGRATVILPETYTDGEYPKTGDVVQVNGKSFEVDRVIRDYDSQSFDEWCVERGYELPELTYEPTFAVAEQYMEKYAEYLTEKIGFFGEPAMIPVKLWYRGLIPDALYWVADELAPTLYPASHLLSYRSLWREAHPGEGSPDEETVRLWAQDMGDNDLSALHKARREEWEEEYYDLLWSGTSKVPNVSGNGYLLNEREAEAAFLRVGKTTALYNGEAY
ncbi:MAG: hypothetical protein J6X72_03350, partial [Clostridia bacterium]|nr:hypothetical protein [Clostridia bacterium]